jgi:hypothetical protein
MRALDGAAATLSQTDVKEVYLGIADHAPKLSRRKRR